MSGSPEVLQGLTEYTFQPGEKVKFVTDNGGVYYANIAPSEKRGIEVTLSYQRGGQTDPEAGYISREQVTIISGDSPYVVTVGVPVDVICSEEAFQTYPVVNIEMVEDEVENT